jgi:hypothetical protein
MATPSAFERFAQANLPEIVAPITVTVVTKVFS